MVNGYGKSSGPKEPQFESQTHTSALSSRQHVLHCSPTHRQPLLLSCALLPLVLIRDPRKTKRSTSLIFSPSIMKSSFISMSLSTTMIVVFCVLSKRFWDMLAYLTFLSRPSNSSLLVQSKVVSSGNRILVSLLLPIVIPSW